MINPNDLLEIQENLNEIKKMLRVQNDIVVKLSEDKKITDNELKLANDRLKEEQKTNHQLIDLLKGIVVTYRSWNNDSHLKDLIDTADTFLDQFTDQEDNTC